MNGSALLKAGRGRFHAMGGVDAICTHGTNGAWTEQWWN